MSDDDDSSDDNVIDITNYVDYKKSSDEVELENFTNQFVAMINHNIIDRQKKDERDRFTYFMVNFVLLTQIVIVIVICFIITKLYS